MSLDADEGTVTTRVLADAAGPLIVNANAHGGSLWVEVLGNDGKALPAYSKDDCVPLRSDSTQQRVRWKTKDSLPLTDKGVRLKFWLKDAKLYAFRNGR